MPTSRGQPSPWNTRGQKGTTERRQSRWESLALLPTLCPSRAGSPECRGLSVVSTGSVLPFKVRSASAKGQPQKPDRTSYALFKLVACTPLSFIYPNPTHSRRSNPKPISSMKPMRSPQPSLPLNTCAIGHVVQSSTVKTLGPEL